MRAHGLLLCAVLCSTGCDDARVYVGDEKIYQVAMTSDTMAAIESEEGGALFIVEQRADLPIIQPTNGELADRTAGLKAYPKLPFPRLPWVERGDLEIQIDFSLHNLDDTSRDVDVIVNGANEFNEYVPGVTIVEEDPIPLHSQWEKRYTVKAKSRLIGTVREEELDEAAVDLATVVNGAPNSDEVVYFENKSATDERSKKFIPAVIPGLVAVRLGLRTNRAANLLLEASIRVRDVGDKLAEDDDPHMRINPEPFEPVLPETD